ncbi:hypothetical protein HPB47_017743 [Ixodes persulcatus]|uniref:Uncharacterized protein n=1 Tax=Ixodes persulcatus TaxID=34615 RepID=A0AC60QNI7_IXOPE|nr:hypothetical protein HPB47_017743 [Ixodes persulcatus]
MWSAPASHGANGWRLDCLTPQIFMPEPPRTSYHFAMFPTTILWPCKEDPALAYGHICIPKLQGIESPHKAYPSEASQHKSSPRLKKTSQSTKPTMNLQSSQTPTAAPVVYLPATSFLQRRE